LPASIVQAALIQAGDVRLPRSNVHLRGDEGRILASPHHHPKPDAGKAQAGELRAQAAPAPSRPRARAPAGKCGPRSSHLLAVPGNTDALDLLPPGGSLLDACAAAAKPAAPTDLSKDGSHRSMGSVCPHRAPPTLLGFRRQDLRQEPVAVVPHGGICPGGYCERMVPTVMIG